jgi:hypothetical protein
MMTVGVASILAAFAILGHDARAGFDRGAWSSTTIGSTLELTQLNDDVVAQLPSIPAVSFDIESPILFCIPGNWSNGQFVRLLF